MKKLLFVLAFVFIGQQAFSQMYSLTVQAYENNHISGCPPYNGLGIQKVMIKINPTGAATYTCIPHEDSGEIHSQWIVVQQEINSILSLGYKVIGTPCDFFRKESGQNINSINNCTWYFAVP